MRGDITLNILEKLKDAARGSVDFCTVMVTAGYGTSYGKFSYEMSKRYSRRERAASDDEKEKLLQRKFRKTISKLEQDGLIEKYERENDTFFKITKSGKNKLAALKLLKENFPSTDKYKKEESKNSIIVTFDIPESLRHKRAWVREVLKRLGFTMVQQSVWMGKIKIPQIFLDDLRNTRILKYVVIFEVSRAGNLEKIT